MAAPNKQLDDIKKRGLLMKLKTKKRKFFVLRDEIDKNNPARLEYYQDEAKFLAAPGKPRRTILLRNCLEITDGVTNNGKTDIKGSSNSSSGNSPAGSNVIHIYTKKDAFKVACSSEKEKGEWLSMLLELKRKSQDDKTLTDQEGFEMSWEVRIMKKSNGSCRKIKPGKYRFCLNSKTITIIGDGGCGTRLEFTLESIRKLGDTKDLFFLELGTSSTIGEGQLWMEVDDPFIASNIHMHVFSLMNEKRPRSQTGVDPRKREGMRSDLIARPPKRPSMQDTVPSPINRDLTGSVRNTMLDAQSSFGYPASLGDHTASSSSVSSLRSSGSSLPSSTNKSQSSVLITGRGSLPFCKEGVGESDGEGLYFPMDGFTKQDDLDIIRTSSVGNKSEYLRNVQSFGQVPRDAEKCSSAPHLQNEGDGNTAEGRLGNCLSIKDTNFNLYKPPPYREGCIHCEPIISLTPSRKEIYSEVKFDIPGKNRHSTSGSSKKELRNKPSFMSKFCAPKQPVGGKIFRSDVQDNYQHFLHHLFLDSNNQDHYQKRKRLPTIDSSMITSRSGACIQLRPRALTGDQKNLPVRPKYPSENSSGYMSMYGAKQFQEHRQQLLTVGVCRSKEDDPYLDMTQGLKTTHVSGQGSDYVDMNLGRSTSVVSPSEPSIVSRLSSGELVHDTVGTRSAKTSEGDVFTDPGYMDMSFDRTAASLTSGSGDRGCSLGSVSSSSNSSVSSTSASSVSSQNVSSATISNLDSTSDYMKMFSYIGMEHNTDKLS